MLNKKIISIPKTGDPLDNRYVDLQFSKTFSEAGEGSFAKTQVAKNTIYSLYGGKFYNKRELRSFVHSANQEFMARNVKLSDLEFEEFWMYR